MPNWVKVKIQASKSAVQAILNENGDVDFNKVIAYPGKDSFDGVLCSAERYAKVAVNYPVSNSQFMGRLDMIARQEGIPSNMQGEEKAQFDEMVDNYTKHGYLHVMDFNTKEWGTKWNACQSSYDEQTGELSFETAWSCPEPVLIAWSKMFPDEVIAIKYADEDIGSNCGTFSLKDGEAIEDDIAPPYQGRSEEDMVKWQKFACEINGYDYEEYMKDISEDEDSDSE